MDAPAPLRDAWAATRRAVARHRSAALAIGVAAIVLGGLWTASAYLAVERTEEVVKGDAWSEHAAFTYSVPVVRDSPAYANGTVLGMGLGYFTAISPRVDLDFNWTFTDPASVPLTGEARLAVLLAWRAPTGEANWSVEQVLDHATLPAAGAGNGVALHGVLDLPALEAQVARTNQALGVADGPVSWTVFATVDFVAQAPFGEVRNASRFALPLTFHGAVYTLPGASGASWDAEHAAQQLVLRQQRGGLAALKAAPLAPLALLGGVVGVALARRRPGDDDLDAAADGANPLAPEVARFEAWVVRVQGPLSLPQEGQALVDVDALEDLVALAAEARTRVLLDEATRACFVLTPAACYRYGKHARDLPTALAAAAGPVIAPLGTERGPPEPLEAGPALGGPGPSSVEPPGFGRRGWERKGRRPRP